MWRRICSFAVRKENKGMRLQSKEIQTIIQIAKDIYGETVQVYLFGSRLNDEKRGGDIDLLGLSGNFWLVSFKISYLCLPLFYETRTTPSCHPSGCAYRQL
jgi:hypothetical protein